jgi:hypothetical protein
MSTKSSPRPRPGSNDDEKCVPKEPDITIDGVSVQGGIDLLALQGVDPALNAKMHLVNNVSINVLISYPCSCHCLHIL